MSEEGVAVAAGSVIGVISLITFFFKRKSVNRYAVSNMSLSSGGANFLLDNSAM